MENNAPNENFISSKGGSKPYKRKINITQKKEDGDKKEDKKIKFKIESQSHYEFQSPKINEKREIEQNNYDNFNEGENIQNINNKYSKNIQNKIKFANNVQDYNNQNKENIKVFVSNNQVKTNNNKDISNMKYIQKKDNNFQIKKLQNQYNIDIDNEDKEYEKNYSYKYKKIKIMKNNIQQEKEETEEYEEDNEEQNEEEDEDEKEEIEKFDYQVIKTKPGKILHQSTQEIYDEEGNRIVTRKTIKEFKQVSGGVQIKKIQREKERNEDERYTTKIAKRRKNFYKSRNANSEYLNGNKGDRLYLLAQLAKLKNEADKKRMKDQIINVNQSPIIIHENNGYNIYENQNSIISDENSYDEEIYERKYNYRNNYRPINNNRQYNEMYYCPTQFIGYSDSNGMKEEYFMQNNTPYKRRHSPSPIGYIATYSSGSEDNEEIGGSYDQNTYNYRNSKNNKKIDKNIYKKEGDLIKGKEVIYQREDSNEYNSFSKRKKNQNMSNLNFNTQIDISKSDKKDFESPDRGPGGGSNKFRKVTMAMISSLGPTCEDRKITRKMRSEVGGVVDLRQELNPVNTYKIKKFRRYGYNLNKEVNPKTKIEGARIIQYWWRALKDKKLYMIKYIKIVKIQSVIRRFLIRKKYIITKITYYIYDTIENIFNNNYKKEFIKLFKYSKRDKAKQKLESILNKLDEKNKRQKILKYFYKFKYIADFLKKNNNSNDMQIINNINKKSIHEEELITYIQNKPETKDIGTENSPEIKEIQKMESITFIKNQSKIKNIPKNTIVNQDKIPIIYNKPITKEQGNEGGSININEISEKKSLLFPKIKKEKIEVNKEEKPVNILKLDNKTEISIINPTKEVKETSTQKEIEENKINKLNQISFLYQKPKTNEQGTGIFTLGEGIDRLNLNYIKEKKEYKDSETEPIIQNMELSKNNLSIIKPKDSNLLKDKNKEIYKLFDKKIIKEKLILSSILYRWRKKALEEKIRNDIDIKRNEKLKIILQLKNNFLKKYLKKKFEQLILVSKRIETIIDKKPENEKVTLEGFIIERKEKPALQIDKKEDYNILKQKKLYKDDEVQNVPETEDNGVNPEAEKNQIIKNELMETIEKINEIHLKPKEKSPLEINNLEKVDIFGKIKNFQDFAIQQNPEIVEEGTQNELYKNEINNKNQLTFLKTKKEMKDEYSKNESYKPKITKNNLNIICKIKKEDEGQQIGSWANMINKSQTISFISNQPKKEEKIIENDIKKAINLEIIKTKKELHDQEMQYIPEENKIQALEMEIIVSKPETKETSSQYIAKKPIICKLLPYSILSKNKKKKELNKFIIDRKNKKSITYKSNKKQLMEKGDQYEIPKEYKSKEIIIGSNIKVSNTQKVIEILEKIWVRKEKTKLIYNFKETSRETIIKRELLRMALLKWRFKKGYGGDKYGNIYDRNGNKIGEKEGLINDVSIQNDLDEEINNEKLKNKLLQIRISKQNPLYIKPDEANRKIMFSIGTGEGPNHTINSKIVKNTTLSYKKKPKPINKIASKNYFKINKVEKKVTNQGTFMPKEKYKIVRENKISFINKDNKLKYYYQNKRRDLMMRIITKNIVKEKYILNNNFSEWYKKTLKIINYENKKTFIKVNPKISKNEKFQIIQKKIKRDISVGNIYVPNQIVHNTKVEYKNKIIKKDVGILIDLPNTFKKENLKARKLNTFIYKSYKKPKILRLMKCESTSFIAPKSNIKENNELGSVLNKKSTDEIKIRITEIFIKYIKSRNSPICILRKYLSIWHRNSKYMDLFRNAKTISFFCKVKLNSVLVRKKWKKIFKKYLFSVKQYKIMTIIKKLKEKRIKLMRLIKKTRLIKSFNIKKYLHYIIMSWFIYTHTNIKKRNHMKMIYENMLTTYVSLADDIFGKNKENNPSLQDCMFEIIETDKFRTKKLEDVPMAKIYYAQRKEERKVVTNMKFIEKEIEEEKESSVYKKMNKTYYSQKRYNIYNEYNKHNNNKNSKYCSQTENINSKNPNNENSYIKVNNRNYIDIININNKKKEGEAIYGRRNNTYRSQKEINSGKKKLSNSIAKYGRRNNTYNVKRDNKKSKSSISINFRSKRYSSDSKKDSDKISDKEKYNKNYSYKKDLKKEEKVNKDENYYKNKYSKYITGTDIKNKIYKEDIKNNRYNKENNDINNKTKPNMKYIYSYSQTSKNKKNEKKKI